jgi:hypothetical protein
MLYGVFSNLWYTEEVTANWISPKVKSMVTAPADRLSRQDLGLLIAEFHRPAISWPPEPIAQAISRSCLLKISPLAKYI